MPRWLPGSLVLAAAAALFLHGPIHQPQAYHAFADARPWLGVPRAGDVLSNVPFALVGLWALLRRRAGLSWTVFDMALVRTAIGSA